MDGVTTGIRGSSPLTRGKRSGEKRAALLRRLIPAHAGKTPKAGSRAALSPAHPRSRGENARDLLSPKDGSGSSPLTRGKRARGDLDRPPVRLIPAHAGKTASQPRESCSLAAHPRSRGENGERRGASMSIGGSSPLTRGKRIRTVAMRPRARLIPAHAGKTRARQE